MALIRAIKPKVQSSTRGMFLFNKRSVSVGLISKTLSHTQNNNLSQKSWPHWSLWHKNMEYLRSKLKKNKVTLWICQEYDRLSENTDSCLLISSIIWFSLSILSITHISIVSEQYDKAQNLIRLITSGNRAHAGQEASSVQMTQKLWVYIVTH